MKKVYVLICVLVTAVLLYGCEGRNDDSIVEPPAQSEAATVFDEEEFLLEIVPNIQCVDSCLAEVFLADVDASDEYFGLYKSEDAYDDGLGEVCILYKNKDDVENYSDYFEDPSYATFSTVLNFHSNEDVRNNLRKYMSDGVIDMYFSDDFLEYEGQLYLIRGGRGYGALSCDFESVQYIEEKDGKHYVSMDILLFDEFEYNQTLELTKAENGWIISDIQENR